MKSQTSPILTSVPPAFLNRFGHSITAVLSGFDRLRLRGTLRHLFQPTVMEAYLNACRILIKDFGTFAQGLTARIKAAAYASAEQAGRPFRFLPSSQISKEALARQIARDDGVTSGLIAIFSALENCLSYSVRGDRQTKHIHLVLEPRKCLHLYHYFLHEELGLCHVRVQTWFPFTVDICLNGRDRLARQMDAAGLAYRQRDNCFVWVEDAARAQALLDDQLRTRWPAVLGRLLHQAHPLHAQICRPIAQNYYWTASASEYATDLLFRDASSLAALYPRLVHHGLSTFASPDVMRFLGRKTPTTGGHARGNFQGEVISDLKHRPEGIRVKHSVNGNSVKMYDKEGSVLRIETTINKTEDFRVYRAKQGEPRGPKSWRPLQRSVGELWRRAQVSAGANGRYLEALASVTDKTPAGQAAAGVCRAVVKKGRRHRALNIFMGRIVGVHHTSFTVANLDRSVSFFRDVLGLEVLFVREVRDEYFSRIVGLPGCVVRAALLRLSSGGHCLELFQYLSPAPRELEAPRPCDPGSCHLSLLVDDLPGFFKQLQGRGVDFIGEPTQITAGPNKGGYGLFLRDPCGILIELFQTPPKEAP